MAEQIRIHVGPTSVNRVCNMLLENPDYPKVQTVKDQTVATQQVSDWGKKEVIFKVHLPSCYADIYIHAYIHTHTYARTHACTHTHRHTHRYIYINPFNNYITQNFNFFPILIKFECYITFYNAKMEPPVIWCTATMAPHLFHFLSLNQYYIYF